MPKAVFDSDASLLEQFESQEEDEEVLEELAEKRRQRQKDFISVVNKRKLGRHELDEVML
ncbi:TPA: hypothetical protein HA231_04110 [Candidatus Woesearchaeota archaeon]|nr:hypothetical protein [Candidatus Woesearchaeota archaeon]